MKTQETLMLLAMAGSVASAGDPFTEEAASRGLDYTFTDHMFGYSALFVDFDMDGDPDLFAVGGDSGKVGLWENDGAGNFSDRAPQARIPGSTMYVAAASADFDNDGDPDLYLCNWFEPDVLLRNDGDFQFTDVTAEAGLGSDGPASSASWTDYDNDGWLDFYVSIWNLDGRAESLLYHNNGDGTFTDVALELGVQDPKSLAFQACFFDFDRDGDQELYTTNDKGYARGCDWPNRFFRNDGGVFADIGADSGAGICCNAMNVGVGDFDRNLYPDVFVTNTSEGNILLLNNGDGTYTDGSGATGTSPIAVGWAGQFLDYDNNAYQDLFVCDMSGPDKLWHNDGQWPVSDAAADMGVADANKSFSASYADADGDGDLDMVRTSNMNPLALYINHEGEHRRWLRVRTLGMSGHPTPGTMVEILDANGVRQYGEVIYNAGYKSQNELVIHFGLDDAASVARVEIAWPDGTTRVLEDVAVNQVILARYCAADVTDDGTIDVQDFFAFLDAFAADESWADWDANGILDSDDFFGFLNDLAGGCS